MEGGDIINIYLYIFVYMYVHVLDGVGQVDLVNRYINIRKDGV